MAAKQTGPVTIYVSHGAGFPAAAGATVDWFIVEPRDDPERLAKQVEWMRRSGRTVIELGVHPYSEGKVSIRLGAPVITP